MVDNHWHNGFDRLRNFKKRIENLLRLDKSSKLATLLIQFCISIFLGKWAWERTHEVSIHSFLETERPPAKWAERLPLSVGFQVLENSKDIRRIYRSLPSRIPDSNSFFVSKDGLWWTLWPAQSTGEYPKVFFRGSSPPWPPSLNSFHWVSHTMNWRDIRKILLSIESSPSPPLKALPIKGDPRALQY